MGEYQDRFHDFGNSWVVDSFSEMGNTVGRKLDYALACLNNHIIVIAFLHSKTAPPTFSFSNK